MVFLTTASTTFSDFGDEENSVDEAMTEELDDDVFDEDGETSPVSDTPEDDPPSDGGEEDDEKLAEMEDDVDEIDSDPFDDLDDR